MKYFLDTEFHEYKRHPWFGKPVDTIELISIGIVAEDGRKFYEISKDFDLKEAWENEWLKENVLKPIHNELAIKENNSIHEEEDWFTYRALYILINKYGKSNQQIAQKVKEFVSYSETSDVYKQIANGSNSPQKGAISFYGYYCDYDWVVFCWLFGRMIDLPEGFPMYCIDLRQEFNRFVRIPIEVVDANGKTPSLSEVSERIKKHPNYPKQTNEHNALADAQWNFELYKFLQTL